MKEKKGFTLIELLMTMAIMTILGSIGFVSLRSVRENARIESAFLIASSVIAPANTCMQRKKMLSDPIVVDAGVCTDAEDTWPSFTDTQWQWHDVTNNAFNDTFTIRASDNAPDKSGCITCSTFSCTKDLSAGCS